MIWKKNSEDRIEESDYLVPILLILQVRKLENAMLVAPLVKTLNAMSLVVIAIKVYFEIGIILKLCRSLIKKTYKS